MKSATDQSAFASSAVYYITHNDSLQVHLHSVSVWDQAECNSFPTMQWKTKWRCWELNLRTSKSSLDKLSQTQTLWVSLKHFDPGLILEPWIWFTRPVQTVSVKSKPAQTRWDRFKRSESGRVRTKYSDSGQSQAGFKRSGFKGVWFKYFVRIYPLWFAFTRWENVGKTLIIFISNIFSSSRVKFVTLSSECQSLYIFKKSL